MAVFSIGSVHQPLLLFRLLVLVVTLRPYPQVQAWAAPEAGHTFLFRQHSIFYEKWSLLQDGEDNGVSKFLNKGTEEYVLLLNGFGVGTFHQHRLVREIQKRFSSTDDHTTVAPRAIYALDYLGQGQSWPKKCAPGGTGRSEVGLRYDGETWVAQILEFCHEVILHPDNGNGEDTDTLARDTQPRIHVIGNSLGGHLAVHCAVREPGMFASVTLLNATPVWGANLPGWSGRLPAPRFAAFVGARLFDLIRSYRTICSFLDNCYPHNKDAAYGADLVEQIRGCTENPGGHAAFASILWSPPVTESFSETLATLTVPTLLMFGKLDPWCTPGIAYKMLRTLETHSSLSAPLYRYVELTNVGHCPNHEAPTAVSTVVTEWWASLSSASASLDGAKKRHESATTDATVRLFSEDWGTTTARSCGSEEIELSWTDRLANRFLP